MALFGKKAEAEVEERVVVDVTTELPGGAWHGASALEPMLRDVGTLKPDERNARTHPERNIDAIADSLTRYGQRKPVIVRGGTVIAGNGTLIAATAKLGWTQLAAIEADDLTEEEARAYAIADNKTSDLAEWDYQVLGEHFRELKNAGLLDATGFADFEIEPLLQADWMPPSATEDGENAPGLHMVTFQATEDQAKIINGALAKVRDGEGDDDISDGRCLELICAEFLS